VKYKDIPEIKPLFRLNPPKKGHRTVKRSFVNKGSLGYRKDAINTLIERML
jgi:large subunit ribosomal protein L30